MERSSVLARLELLGLITDGWCSDMYKLDQLRR